MDQYILCNKIKTNKIIIILQLIKKNWTIKNI